MIKKIKVENYKAFKKGELKIKPITILLGINSAGKSSLIQLFLMLTQTFSSRKSRQNILQLNSDLVKLGESKNIFHNKKTTSNIGLSFDIPAIEYDKLIENIKEYIFDIYYFLDKIHSMISSKEEDIAYNKRSGGFRYRFPKEFGEIEDFQNIFSKLISLKRKINIQSKDLPDADFEKLIGMSFRSSRYIYEKQFFSLKEKKITFDFTPLNHAFQFALKLKELKISDIKVEYDIKFNNKSSNIELGGFKIISAKGIILEYDYKNVRRGKHHILKSEVFDNNILDKYSSKFGNTIDLSDIEIVRKTLSTRRIKESYFIEFLLKLVELSISPIKDTFSYRNINYINPLRAYPRRYYFQDEVVNSYSISTIDSIQLIDLFRERSDIKKKVNGWMKKFNINVDIDQLEEVIHKIRINHGGLSLDLTDVGFGISQVMPIIAQCYLARPNSITLIEQPEIHLHPKMQSDLADLFIETCIDESGKKNFIIETHSEYILKRLRRRISENKISANDVGLYFIHSKSESENYARIEEIEISNSGDFTWPKDFYAEELKDTIEFLKNQK